MPTLTFYPSAGSVSPVDGGANRDSVNETFAQIIAGAGDSTSTDNDTTHYALLFASTTTNKFEILQRPIICFDTSSIPDGATITSATLSLRGTSKGNGLGSPALHIVSANPASTSTIANADYSTLGSTSFGNVPYSSFSTTGYNNIALNSSGLANISKTGVTKFGAKLSWDLNGSFTGTWSSGQISGFEWSSADVAGTTSDPKLTVTYVTAPTVTTQAVTNNTSLFTATGNGTVTDDGGTTVYSAGVCINTTGSPTISDTVYNATTSSATAIGFTDNFTTSYDATKWTSFVTGSATVSIDDNELLLTPPTATAGSNFAGLITQTTYDFTGKAAWIEAVQVASTGSNAQTDFVLQIDNSNVVQWIQEAGTLYARKVVAGVTTNVFTVAYSSTTHRWWRIRESGGNTLWDTSADGVTWTNRATAANPITMTALYVVLTGGTYQSEVNPGAARFDNFNIPGIASPFTASMTSLIPGQTYYVRAFATNNEGTGYGSDVTFTATNFLNPTQAYTEDGTFCTAGGDTGNISIQLSGDGGTTWSNTLSNTFNGTNGFLTYGAGSTELWGLAWLGSNVSDTNFRLRVSCGTRSSFTHSWKTFGFAPTSTVVLTGIEVKVKAKWVTDTTSIDVIQVKIYYGTSTFPIQAGSQAYATDAGGGTGALEVYNGSGWKEVADTSSTQTLTNKTLSTGSVIDSSVTVTEVLKKVYPVGSYYINETNSTNPATLLGFGTWTAVTDVFIVGHGSTYTATGGSATHTHTLSDVGGAAINASTNVITERRTTLSWTATNTHNPTQNNSATSSAQTVATALVGSTDSTTNVPPYQAAYIWKRTA